jgi:hypothetical protein
VKEQDETVLQLIASTVQYGKQGDEKKVLKFEHKQEIENREHYH